MFNNDKQLGLFRYTDYATQREIDSDLGLCFEDLFDSVDSVRESAVEAEQVIKRILFGESYGREIRDRLFKSL